MLSFQQKTNKNSFWTKGDLPLELFNELKCDAYLKGDFRKVGKIFSIPTNRSYYLLKNYLLYGNINKMVVNSFNMQETLSSCKGYAFLTPIYVDFGIDEKYYIIKLISDHEEVSLQTSNGLQFLQWQEALSNICIMTTFLQDFHVEEQIGEGNFSTVHRCISQRAMKQYAVKIVERNLFKQSPFMKDSVVNEIIALRQLNHPNVLKIYRIYDSAQFIYIVTELLSGGTLIQKSGRIKKFNIQELKIIMKNLLEAVNHIHMNKIIHRDVKPDNILYNNKENPLEVVIIDFGLAALIKHDRYGYPKCGSPGYSAPEVLNYVEGKKLYTSKCDVYSLGITFFILFYGFNPFLTDDFGKSLRNNREGNIEFPKNTVVPSQVQKLLDSMLKKNPKERYTANEALDDPFFHTKIESQFDFRIYKMVFTKVQFEKKQLKYQERLKKPSFSIQSTFKDQTQNFMSNQSLIQLQHMLNLSPSECYDVLQTKITNKTQSNKTIQQNIINELKYRGIKINQSVDVDLNKPKIKVPKKNKQGPHYRPKSQTTSKAQHFSQFMEPFSSNSELFSQTPEDRTVPINRQGAESHQIQELGQELEQDEQQNQQKNSNSYQQQGGLEKKSYHQLQPQQQLIYTSDHLSTIPSQVNVESDRPKQFSFCASVTPFQKYKSDKNSKIFQSDNQRSNLLQ